MITSPRFEWTQAAPSPAVVNIAASRTADLLVLVQQFEKYVSIINERELRDGYPFLFDTLKESRRVLDEIERETA